MCPKITKNIMKQFNRQYVYLRIIYGAMMMIHLQPIFFVKQQKKVMVECDWMQFYAFICYLFLFFISFFTWVTWKRDTEMRHVIYRAFSKWVKAMNHIYIISFFLTTTIMVINHDASFSLSCRVGELNSAGRNVTSHSFPSSHMFGCSSLILSRRGCVVLVCLSGGVYT